MSTLAEIEAAADKLSPAQQKALYAFLAGRLSRSKNHVRAKPRRGSTAAAYPALKGLPADLSVGTKARVRALVTERYAAHR